MNYLLPMAGEGARFIADGYTVSKPLLPIVDYHTGQKIPMALAALKDFPFISQNSKILLIDRDFHQKQDIQVDIRNHYDHAHFLTLNESTSGTAATCLRAEHLIQRDEELFIGSCDNGMIYDSQTFEQTKSIADVLVFTHRRHESVCSKPEAFGWVQVDANNYAIAVSVKKPISNRPIDDHAVVGAFWYRKGAFFLDSAVEMIAREDKVNNEYYIDQSINYCIRQGLRVSVFEIKRYLNWGDPLEYENYHRTINYWKSFHAKHEF